MVMAEFYLTLPTVLGIILTKCLHMSAGKKSKNQEIRIPQFIRESKDENILTNFLRAIYDDEGNVNTRSKLIRIEKVKI